MVLQTENALLCGHHKARLSLIGKPQFLPTEGWLTSELENRMKAVGFQKPGPIERQDALQDITLEKPVAHGRDLLVEIKAVSVNPVDTKVRVNRQP